MCASCSNSEGAGAQLHTGTPASVIDIFHTKLIHTQLQSSECELAQINVTIPCGHVLCAQANALLVPPCLPQNVVVSFFNSPHFALSIYHKTVVHTSENTLATQPAHNSPTHRANGMEIFKLSSAHGQVAEQQNETIEIAKSKANINTIRSWPSVSGRRRQLSELHERFFLVQQHVVAVGDQAAGRKGERCE